MSAVQIEPPARRAGALRRAIFVIVCCMISVGFGSSGAEPLQRFEYQQRHMGVITRIVLYASDEAIARSAAQAAFRRMAALDDIMSDYRPHSELMRFAAGAGGPPVALSEDLFQVLEKAQTLARLSDGAFDVTAGAQVRLWREARASGAVPTVAALAEARGRTGWQHLRLDPTTRAGQLLIPGIQLDLGGIAKGYAADHALLVLQQHGIDRALVEIGGDMAIGAPPPDRAGWQITVQDAGPDWGSLLLAHTAISSSGDTEQFVVIDGRRYSHIVDPRTGIGLTDRVAVTVLAPSAALSDGLSTLISVLGPERGIPLIARHYPTVHVHVRRLAN
jgi:FAD:protein FMN transferase